MNVQYACVGAVVVGWAAISVANGSDTRLLLPGAGLVGLVSVLLKNMAALRSELERIKFQLDTEVESSAILAKELELMLVKQRDSSPKKRDNKIGAFWSGSAASTREDETKDEKEQRVAEYLEDVGGIVVSEADLRRWVRAQDGLKKAEADIDMARALLSKSLCGGRNKTEAINEALFILSKDVV